MSVGWLLLSAVNTLRSHLNLKSTGWTNPFLEIFFMLDWIPSSPKRRPIECACNQGKKSGNDKPKKILHNNT